MEVFLSLRDYLKKAKRNLILNSYYTKKMKDGKTMKASIFDWVFITIVLMLFLLISIYNATRNITASIILTIILMIIYLLGLLNHKKRTRIKNINEINEIIWEEEIIEKLDKFTDDDYLLYLKDLLEEYYDSKFVRYDNNIDFIGEINQEVYGVKCIKRPLDDKTTLKDLKYYIREMKENNVEHGIIISNSYFHEEVKNEINYLLIDFYQLKDILKQIDRFPTKDKLEDKIIVKYDDEKSILKKKLSINKKDKVYKFILLGIVLYFISPIVAYPLYYKTVAIVLIVIGITIGVYNFKIYLNNRGM